MIREIVQYGHPILRQRCRPVTEVNDGVVQLVADMLETMVEAHGVGLAAPQVAEDIRLAVIDVSHDPECVSFLKVNGEDAMCAMATDSHSDEFSHLSLVLDRPQALAAIEPHRAQGVGLGQQFQGAAGEVCGPRDAGQCPRAGGPRGHDGHGVVLAKAGDLAQAQAEGAPPP